MTLAFMCDNCGTFESYRHAFKLDVPLDSGQDLHFCSKKCLIEYLNREYNDK